MGGMFGTRKIKSISSWSKLIQSKELNDLGRKFYNTDQDLLNKYIYPIIKNNCFIHSTFGKLLYETTYYTIMYF